MQIGSSNEYSHGKVPREATVSGWHIALIKIGVLIALPAFVAGAQLGFTMGLPRAGLAMYLGAAVLGIIACLTGTVAAKSRQSTALLVRYAFGTQGARFVGGLLAFTLLGMFGVTAELFGQSLAPVAKALIGQDLGVKVWISIGGLLMVLTTIYGFSGLQKLADAAVPLLLLAMLGIAWYTAIRGDADILMKTPETVPPLGLGISAVIGAVIVGVTILPDLARFARSVRHAQCAAVGCYALTYPTVLLLAAIPSIMTGNPDLVVIIMTLGFGFPAFLFLVFTAWTSNSGNLYSASLGFANVFTRARFSVIAGIAGLFGVALALMGITEKLFPLLVSLSVAIPPIAGIYSVDFFLIRHRRYDEESLKSLPAVSWTAFTAWIVAVIVAIASARGYVSLTHVPGVDSMLIASILYFVLAKYATRLRPGIAPKAEQGDANNV